MVMMNHPQNLVSLYRKFYRASTARKFHPSSARKLIQPLYEANEIICRVDVELRSAENLALAIAGHTAKLMQRIRSTSETLGYWVISDQAEERQAILRFAEYLVNEVFYKSFNGDVARFSGKQRGILEDTCEFLYKLADDVEKIARRESAETEEKSNLDEYEIA